MAKIIFGVWEDKVYDNRKKRLFEIDEIDGFENLNQFDPGNPIKIFIGDRGFYVLDENVNVLDGIIQHINRAARESCGKCTPCRVGLQVLKNKLEKLSFGDDCTFKLEEILKYAKQIKDTSLCGIGKTSTIALILLIEKFSEEILKNLDSEIRKQPYSAYVTAPCIEACPARVEVPKYIDYIKDGKFSHSLGVVLQKYPMAATCGRVCVRFCEEACQRTQVDDAVGIKVLKRFVADNESDVSNQLFNKDLIKDMKPKDLKIAIIGSGPAGISAAYHLLLKGYKVDVYEALSEAGGMAAVGIPEYRLPNEVLQKEINIIEKLGGKIYYNKRLGKNITIESLKKKGYKAIFLGIGAHNAKKINIPGENRSIQGYISGVKFLLYINHYYINLELNVDLGDLIVVVGGGNVAMDCARSALRMGVKDVHLIYRRTKNEMPADLEEIEACEKEGIIFHYLTHPTKIITKNGKVEGIELIDMELGKKDSSGRNSVSPKENSEHILKTNFIVPAIGQAVDHSFATKRDNIGINRWGLIEVNEETAMTSNIGVFAGGDCVSGPATLIEAMANGEKGAEEIDDYLMYGKSKFNKNRRMSQILKSVSEKNSEMVSAPIKHQYKISIEELDPDIRKKIFDEVEKPIPTTKAYEEASRCMRCYRIYSVITKR